MKRIIVAATATVALIAGASVLSAQTIVIGPDQETRIKRVVKDKGNRVIIKERVTVGGELPAAITLSPFPSDVEGVTEYRYVYDDSGRILVVQPSTRKVVRIIEE